MAKTIEGKSRLIHLVYEVLNKIDVVVAGKSDDELIAVLVSAFHRHATDLRAAESSQPKPRGKPRLPEALIYPHAEGGRIIAIGAGGKVFRPSEGSDSSATGLVRARAGTAGQAQ